MQGHYLLGLKVLNLLVTEFNQPTTGRTMTQHRKMAVVFRDNALFKIFQIAISALQLLQTHATADDKLREQVCWPIVMQETSILHNQALRICLLAMKLARHTSVQWTGLHEVKRALDVCVQAVSLALQCLSFDFVGTCLDESAEDLGTIQVY